MTSSAAIAMRPIEAGACGSWERPEVPHPQPFVAEFRVDDSHAGDVVAHVDNTQYVRWLDKAAQMHADSLGFTRDVMMQRGVMWFVARHEIDYVAEVWPGDSLRIITWVRDIRRIKSWRDYVVYRPEDDCIVCRASTLWVLVDLSSRKPTRVHADMVGQFRPLHTRA